MPLRAFFVFPLFPTRLGAMRRPKGFNALTGILCFSTRCNVVPDWGRLWIVSMPLRAFFVFPRWEKLIEAVEEKLGFNALTGILCFSTHVLEGAPRVARTVSMPLRAFFVFPPVLQGWWRRHSLSVSMPLRAFFVFPQTISP